MQAEPLLLRGLVLVLWALVLALALMLRTLVLAAMVLLAALVLLAVLVLPRTAVTTAAARGGTSKAAREENAMRIQAVLPPQLGLCSSTVCLFELDQWFRVPCNPSQQCCLVPVRMSPNGYQQRGPLT